MTTSEAPAATPDDCILTPDEELAQVGGVDRRRPTVLLVGAFALGCMACLLPGILAVGALAATLGSLGADEIVFGALAVVLTIAAVAVVLVRRARKAASATDGCGC